MASTPVRIALTGSPTRVVTVCSSRSRWPSGARLGAWRAIGTATPVSIPVAVRDWVGAEAGTLAREIKDNLIPLANGKHDAIPAKLNRFTKMSSENRELFSILSTAQTQADWLDSKPIRRDLEKGAADFGSMK